MIRHSDIAYVELARKESAEAAIRLYCKILQGDPLPEDADITHVLAIIASMERDLSSFPRLTFDHIRQLASGVYQRARTRRDAAERAGHGYFSFAFAHAVAGVAILAIRLLPGFTRISLTHLQPVIEYLHS